MAADDDESAGDSTNKRRRTEDSVASSRASSQSQFATSSSDGYPDDASSYICSATDNITPLRVKRQCRSEPIKKKGKTIHDRIYGSIDLPALLVAVMDTPEFERLDHINQLGGSAIVYPSARHTRKEHSIGVAYLAGQFVEHLAKEQPELGITKVDILCLQLAGLTHDLGHGPFSHMWEKFMVAATGSHGWSHESMSMKLLKRIFGGDNNSIAEEREWAYYFDCPVHHVRWHVEFTCCLIKGLKENEAWPENIGRDQQKRFLFDIVSNSRSGVDVDKIDYLNRDHLSAFGGGSSFDWRRLAGSLRVFDAPKSGYTEIGYEEKMVTDINAIFAKRALMHLQVYQHRVSNCYEAMLNDVLLEAEKSEYRVRNPRSGGPPLKISEASVDPEAFVWLNDGIFDVIKLSSAKGLGKAHEILDRMQSRRFYTQVLRPLSLPTLPLCRDCRKETEFDDRFCRFCSATTETRMTACADTSCRKCGETPENPRRCTNRDALMYPSWVKFNEDDAKKAILSILRDEGRTVDPAMIHVSITDITHGWKSELRDPHKENKKNWSVRDPVAQVKFYNPKEEPPKLKIIDCSKIPGLFMPKKLQSRSLYLYYKGSAQSVEYANLEDAFERFAVTRDLKHHIAPSNPAPASGGRSGQRREDAREDAENEDRLANAPHAPRLDDYDDSRRTLALTNV